MDLEQARHCTPETRTAIGTVLRYLRQGHTLPDAIAQSSQHYERDSPTRLALDRMAQGLSRNPSAIPHPSEMARLRMADSSARIRYSRASREQGHPPRVTNSALSQEGINKAAALASTLGISFGAASQVLRALGA